MMINDGISLPLIGEDAPKFSALSTKGVINFPQDYRGKWVILFSHPADFTPVCTSEMIAFAQMYDAFREVDAELLAVSIDRIGSHLEWIKKIEDHLMTPGMTKVRIEYPIIADIKMEIVKKYGMIQPLASDEKTVRSLFFIDPQGVVRALSYYPLLNGRNVQEVYRLLLAMQTSDAFGVATPADWYPGDNILVSAPTTLYGIEEQSRVADERITCRNWFFCTKQLSKEEITHHLSQNSSEP